MSAAQILAELPQLSRDELAAVRAKLDQLAAGEANAGIAAHPAIGLWRDRVDLPSDSIDASRTLRQRLMRDDDRPRDA